MEIVLVGVSHKTAPVETRERLAVLEGHVPAAIQALIGAGSIQECCILSTCNRTELYAVGEAAGHASDAIVAHLSARHGISREVLQPHLYHRFNDEAVRHLFTVSAGLDSMIVGEGQILSQVRKAHRLALETHSLGTVMGKLFERAIRVGKRVRTETKISQGAASVSFAAVELARKIYGDLARKRVLVVGTGKMGVLTMRLLVGAGVANITVLSRRGERARRVLAEFSERVESKCGDLQQLTDELATADIVISCTASPHAVILRQQVKSILRKRRYRPLFIVDIAVPRDVEPAVNELENVYLYNIDDLTSVVKDALADRGREIDQVRAIVEDELLTFSRYYTALETVPAIKRLREAFERTREREMEGLAARERLSDADRTRLDGFSRGLLARLLHLPIMRIKALAATQNVHEGVHFLLQLFEEEGPALPEGSNAAVPVPSQPPSPVPSHDPKHELAGPNAAAQERAGPLDPQEEIAP